MSKMVPGMAGVTLYVWVVIVKETKCSWSCTHLPLSQPAPLMFAACKKIPMSVTNLRLEMFGLETLISESTCYELPHDLFPEEKGDMQAISPNLVYKKNQRAAWSICCLYSDCCVFKSGKITCLWESDEEDVCSPCRQRRWTLSGYWLDPVLCVLCLVVEVVNIVVTFVLRIWSNTIYFTLAEFDLFKFVKIKCISNLGLSSLKALSIIAYKLACWILTAKAVLCRVAHKLFN